MSIRAFFEKEKAVHRSPFAPPIFDFGEGACDSMLGQASKGYSILIFLSSILACGQCESAIQYNHCMTTLSRTDIDTIARLARLSLNEEEKVRYAEQLSVVFDYFEMLREVDVRATVETCQVTGLEDVTREDVAVACDEETKKKLIESWPEKAGVLLKVPGVFDASL